MKTTVEIPDDLFREARVYAAQNGLHLREIVERGVRMVVSARPEPPKQFRLRYVTTHGEGLVCDDNWSAIRSLIYDGQNGDGQDGEGQSGEGHGEVTG